MAQIKGQKKKLLIALPFIIIFILLANLCDTGILPGWIQKPLDSLNRATGGLIYEQNQNTFGLSVHFIDVGQGDCILVCCDGKNMLIDGGTLDKGKTVENYLKSCGVRNLSYVIGTHPHDDHIGGLVTVLNDMPVDTVIMNNAVTTTQTYEDLLKAVEDKGKKITRARVGSIYSLGSAKFTVLAPVKEYDDLNETSVTVRLTYKDKSFLFTGDASQESEQDMLAENSDLSADVLKVGHHGSLTATSQEFLNEVHPEYAVVSVGTGNSYGLPNTEVIQRLKNANVTILRTDTDGTIIFEYDGQNMKVKKENKSGEFN